MNALRSGLASLILLVLLPQQAAANPSFMLLEVTLNGYQPGQTVRLLEADHRLYIAERDLERLRIRHEDAARLTHGPMTYIALDEIRNLQYAVELETARLHIECRPSCFPSSQLEAAASVPTTPDPSGTGAFLNYDILGQFGLTRTEDDNARLDATAEAGVFTDHGAGQSRFLIRDSYPETQVVRLESAWTIDDVSDRKRLRLGDSITRPGAWSVPVRFGGVQFGTDFSLQPGFITFPTAAIAGEAALPSTVELYVNDIRRFEGDIPAGPFAITDLPVMSGSGETRVVVTDLLGREQVLTADYYASPALLKPGLSDYSVELGQLREDFGRLSNRYEEPFANGTYRRGLSDALTGEFHGQVSDRRGAMGVHFDWLAPDVGLFGSSLAFSKRADGFGVLPELSYEWSSRAFTFGVETRFATENFTLLGQRLDKRPPVNQTLARGGVGLGEWGNLSAAYTQRFERDSDDIGILSLNHTIGLRDYGALTLSGFRAFGASSSYSAGLFYTIYFGDGVTGGAGLNQTQGETRASLRVHKVPPSDGGLGYRALAEHGDSDRLEGGLSYRTEVGDFQGEVARANRRDVARLNARGGFALVEGQVFPSRSFTDSFAVVDVGGLENIRVYQNNRPVGRTDGSGHLLMPSLQSYQKHAVSIDPRDLPLDTVVGSVETDVVPRYRSGAVVSFPVRRVRSALVTIVTADGNPVPPGAVVESLDGEEKAVVGAEGKSYLVDIASGDRLKVRGPDVDCEFALETLPDDRPFLSLGPLPCREAER